MNEYDYILDEPLRHWSEAMCKVGSAAADACAAFQQFQEQISMQYYIACAKNPRIEHIAANSKKARVRKKNLRRLVKIAEKHSK